MSSNSKSDAEVRHAGRSVRSEMTTSAPPDRVYAAFADPAHIARWFTDSPRGEPARTGGKVTWAFDRFGVVVDLDVLVAEPGRRLALRGERPGAPRANVVDVTIEHGGGLTTLRVVESGFGDDASADEHMEGNRSGWTMALALLGHYLDGRFGRDSRRFLVMRPARFDFAEAFARHATTEGLRSWLAKDARVDGRSYALTLGDGRKLSGAVLARSGFETALTAREVDGVIELKSIKTGPDSALLAARGTLWGGDAAACAALEGEFASALQRLERAIAR